MLFASDLDNTIIYSYKNALPGSICVEKNDEKELSFMTEKAFRLLQYVDSRLTFVPVTTRSVEQYRRIVLLKKGSPRCALTSNGGILLNDGEIDKKWLSSSKERIISSYSEIKKAARILEKDKSVYFEVRLVDGLFIFTKTSEPEKTKQTLKQKLDITKVFVETNGDKIYVVPCPLNKGEALIRIKQKLKEKFVISAGDSYFDKPMLLQANIGLIPENKELFEISYKKSIVACRDTGMGFGDALLDYVVNLLSTA